MGRAEPISVIKTRVELGHTGEPVKHIKTLMVVILSCWAYIH